MACITTVTYSVLINDQPYGLIAPQRGLRQGDPLSPFLFVLCLEALSHLLIQVEHMGKIEGLKFSEDGPLIHHLLFTDDGLFVCKANVEQANELKVIMSNYGRATGQSVNLEKSAISFGSRIDEQVKKKIQEYLGIFLEGETSTYLGLHKCFSGSKIDMLAHIKDKMKARMSG